MPDAGNTPAWFRRSRERGPKGNAPTVLRHSCQRRTAAAHTVAGPKPKEQLVQDTVKHDDALPHVGHSASHTSTR